MYYVNFLFFQQPLENVEPNLQPFQPLEKVDPNP